MMPIPKRFHLALFVATLLNVFILGCAQMGYARNSYAQNVDCRSCHVQGAAAADFGAIYADPKSHHPVDIVYPGGLTANANFNQPNGQNAGTTFFDTNGNGQPDGNEVQLFGATGSATITCATCHKEHGTVPPTPDTSADAYLRVSLTGSALCSICHSQ